MFAATAEAEISKYESIRKFRHGRKRVNKPNPVIKPEAAGKTQCILCVYPVQPNQKIPPAKGIQPYIDGRRRHSGTVISLFARKRRVYDG